MTTALPDLAPGPVAPAARPARGVAVDVGREAARLAGLPCTWASSIRDLLEAEAHQVVEDNGGTTTGGGEADRKGRTTAGTEFTTPSLADLDAALDEIGELEARVAALHARRAELIARASLLAEALEADLVDDSDPVARSAPSARRLDLARRAVTAELATALHLGEHAIETLAEHATTLTTTAPATLTALHQGRLSWAHATALTKHLTDLTRSEAARVEASVLASVLADAEGPNGPGITCTPAQVGARARRAREDAHPTPADVRRTEAAGRRDVWLDEGRDGMAWLTAHLPAPLAHAAYDRLTRTARHLVTPDLNSAGVPRSPADGSRTRAQARADAFAALLLDDGTLDHTISGDTTIAPGPTTSCAPDAAPGSAPDPVQRLLHEQSDLATLARSIRPQVTVTVPVLTLLGITDAPATMDGHVPVDPDTARTLTALAPSLRRILTHPETGAVLSVGRTTYTVPADLKSLVTTRDTTCRFPGCTHPARRADLDHTTPWASGGTTSTGNLAALCRRHHSLKHQTRWHVRQVDDDTATGWGGALAWTSPTGRTYRTAPEPVETTRHRAVPRGDAPPAEAPALPGGDPFDDPPF